MEVSEKVLSKKHVPNLFFYRSLRKNSTPIRYYCLLKGTFSLLSEKNVCIIILNLIDWKV